MIDLPKMMSDIPGTVAALGKEEKSSAMSILAALLDAQIVFREAGLAENAFEPLRGAFYPGEEPEQNIRRLFAIGLIRSGEQGRLTVPEEIKLPLSREMEIFLRTKEIRLPSKTVPLGSLLDEFEAYCRDECGIDPTSEAGALPFWGGKEIRLSGRSHLLLIRPFPVFLRSCENAFILLLGRIPESGAWALADLFCSDSALRQRLAFLDLEGGQKMNLTKSHVSVFFERFLMRAHGLRLAPSEVLTRGLVDHGLLSFDKG